MSITFDPARRQVLRAGAALAGATLAPGLVLYEVAQARAAGDAARKGVRWGLLVDVDRCSTGCDACVSACREENRLPVPVHATDVRWIRKLEIVDAGRPVRALPVMCQHCAEPPCVDVCPTGASFKRADGIVLVDRHRCIGCRYCMMACPYQARSFVHEPVSGQNPDVPRGKGCVESCDLCVHRVDRGERPACVDACAATGRNALLFGDLNDPSSEIARRVKAVTTTQLRADLATEPGVRYQGL
jgi:molybdopterin-containing oxidoreductase family iron-sulfur binding subunit